MGTISLESVGGILMFFLAFEDGVLLLGRSGFAGFWIALRACVGLFGD